MFPVLKEHSKEASGTRWTVHGHEGRAVFGNSVHEVLVEHNEKTLDFILNFSIFANHYVHYRVYSIFAIIIS